MKYWLLAGLLGLASFSATALELRGVQLEDQVQVADQKLELNGAGLRGFLFFRMYVAGLYLDGRKASADAVFADNGAKRIALHVVTDNDEPAHFQKGFRKGFEQNLGAEQLTPLQQRMEAFIHLFDGVKEVKKGDEIDLDWQPDGGTHVIFNGAELGQVAGEDFYRALLAIWLGEKPVSSDVKKGMLGG